MVRGWYDGGTRVFLLERVRLAAAGVVTGQPHLRDLSKLDLAAKFTHRLVFVVAQGVILELMGGKGDVA